MTMIELIGRVNERGELEIDLPANVPQGEVRVIIESVDPELEAADEALWDAKFANSQDVLDRLAQEAHEAYLAGRTEEFDPDTDPDLQ
jgi:hypothetical protein